MSIIVTLSLSPTSMFFQEVNSHLEGQFEMPDSFAPQRGDKFVVMVPPGDTSAEIVHVNDFVTRDLYIADVSWRLIATCNTYMCMHLVLSSEMPPEPPHASRAQEREEVMSIRIRVTIKGRPCTSFQHNYCAGHRGEP